MKVNPNTNQLNQKVLSREDMRKPYIEVAEGMETQFTNHMIAQMRKTIPRDDEPSSAQSFYESMMDDEYAKAMAKSDTGLGLKRVILDQIMPEHLKQKVVPKNAAQAYNIEQMKSATVKGVDE